MKMLVMNFSKLFALVTILFTTIPISLLSQVTFSEHIAPIIYDNCTSCHRAGEIGPMSLNNYEEVAEWANMIKYVTEIKYMPPWSPDATYSHFVNERVLSPEEIQLIADWVEAGAPEGDPAKAPPAPTFPSGSQIGVPDLVLEMEQEHFIKGNNQDDYRVFVIPTGFLEDKEIAAIEFRPDNKKAVHHVLMGYDISGRARARDAQSPEYGYFSFGDFGINEAVMLSWGYVPGNAPLVYPEGIGEVIPKGADFLIQVHYAPLPTDEVDKSSINIFFKKDHDPILRPVVKAWTLPFNLQGGWSSFLIYPNSKPTFVAKDFFEFDSFSPGVNYDVSLIGVQPHAHYLGESYEIFAVTPEKDTINIIRIPEWDFNWQGAYTLNKMIKIPKGSTWYTIATYNNTADNPANPSNPPKFVSWGEGTEDEMFLSFFHFVPYQEGDENIDLSNTNLVTSVQVSQSTKSMLYPPSPNPAIGDVALSFYLDQSEPLRFELFDVNGRMVRTIATQRWPKGGHRLTLPTQGLASGSYFVKMTGNNYQMSQKLIITK